ncbi:MAG: hypothetical protein ACLQAT_13845 [Candidatus Binataceae bacterium]
MNVIHHPVAISSTFHHELAHHLIAEQIGQMREVSVAGCDSQYEHHLDKPVELLADIYAALVAYPRPVARELFQNSPTTTVLVKNAAAHLRRSYGFQFNNALSKEQTEDYLSGLVHFAKLRTAVLEEFGI